MQSDYKVGSIASLLSSGRGANDSGEATKIVKNKSILGLSKSALNHKEKIASLELFTKKFPKPAKVNTNIQSPPINVSANKVPEASKAVENVAHCSEKKTKAKRRKEKTEARVLERERLVLGDPRGIEPPAKKSKVKESNEKEANLPDRVPHVDSDDDGQSQNEPRKRGAKVHITPKQKELQEEKNLRTLFIGNLPKDTKKELKKLFKQYGRVVTIRFRSLAPSDPSMPLKLVAIKGALHESRNTVNAYIEFSTADDASNALVLNGTMFGSCYIRCDLAGRAGQHDHKHSIFVGNLPFDIEDDALREFFKECGDIQGIRVIRDRKTSIGKGFGYLLFKSMDSVTLALKLNGSQLDGRELRISRSVKKSKPNANRVQPQQTGRLAKKVKAGHHEDQKQSSQSVGQKAKRFKKQRSFATNAATTVAAFTENQSKVKRKLKKKQPRKTVRSTAFRMSGKKQPSKAGKQKHQKKSSKHT
ncbi:PREDICTED: RNA-binding protein 34-like isoform X2 [Priapulus caudatus]|uniref:RNA-binding protein 34-like isoform X2 n=1 Tax=Priapulus caudatus TaxID=37621 RepID=A0ABM1DW20_PRICU|nr:PREDICTED: RNA-binding protein 34-like isoform X2 [Priapulus caudatus]